MLVEVRRPSLVSMARQAGPDVRRGVPECGAARPKSRAGTTSGHPNPALSHQHPLNAGCAPKADRKPPGPHPDSSEVLGCRGGGLLTAHATCARFIIAVDQRAWAPCAAKKPPSRRHSDAQSPTTHLRRI